MICGRCDKPILPGEPYTHHDKISASAGGVTVYLHVQACTPVPTQTSQASIRH